MYIYVYIICVYAMLIIFCVFRFHKLRQNVEQQQQQRNARTGGIVLNVLKILDRAGSVPCVAMFVTIRFVLSMCNARPSAQSVTEF